MNKGEFAKILEQGLMNELPFRGNYMVDLHGLSVDQASVAVHQQLSLAEKMKMSEIRFVTGRGNHINKKGERGTLFRELPNWLPAELLHRFAPLKKGDGYYELRVKPEAEENQGLLPDEFIQHCLISNLEEIIKSAQNHKIEDQLLLAHCYQQGIGLKQDYKKAVFWLKEAAEAGDPSAQFALGACYWQGRGVRQNDQQAIALFEKAAAQNFVCALNHLGDTYLYGDGVKEDLARSYHYYQKASDLGLILAKRKLAHAHFWGRGVPQDEKIAFSLYKQAADAGDAHSAYNVACAYSYGRGVEKNLELAFFYGKQAADHNDPDAQYLMYSFYTQGIGTVQNSQLGHEYLVKAGNNNFKHALFVLAFYSPKGGKIDHLEKIDYLIKAAKAEQIIAQAFVLSKPLLPENERNIILKSFWEQEDTEVFAIQNTSFKFMVIDTYLAESLTKKQQKKIRSLLLCLAQQHCPGSLLRLGSIYREGLWGKKDSELAEKYWQQGARINDANCLCSLGYFYEEKATQKDYEKAFAYHRQAAQQGSANSYNQLGILYKEGKGIKKDIALAIDCFHRAMKLGDDEKRTVTTRSHAAYNLAMVYFMGDDDFPKDRKQAIVWFELAAKGGHEQGKEMIRRLGLSELNYQSASNSLFWKAAASNPLPVEEKDQKQDPKTILNAFTDFLGIKVRWNLTKSDQAWCYINADEFASLKECSLEPFVLRRSVEKKPILFLEKVSTYDLHEITKTFKEQFELTNGYPLVRLGLD